MRTLPGTGLGVFGRRDKMQRFRSLVAEDLMSENPIVVGVTDSVGRTLMKLVGASVRHLPVVDDGALRGVVSDRDLQEAMQVLLKDPERPKDHPWDLPVSAVMNGDVISVSPETGIDEIIDLMIDQKIGAVPVAEPDTSKVVGIVSYVDVLRAARQALA